MGAETWIRTPWGTFEVCGWKSTKILGGQKAFCFRFLGCISYIYLEVFVASLLLKPWMKDVHAFVQQPVMSKTCISTIDSNGVQLKPTAIKPSKQHPVLEHRDLNCAKPGGWRQVAGRLHANAICHWDEKCQFAYQRSTRQTIYCSKPWLRFTQINLFGLFGRSPNWRHSMFAKSSEEEDLKDLEHP